MHFLGEGVRNCQGGMAIFGWFWTWFFCRKSVVLLRGLEIGELGEFPSEPGPVLHSLGSWKGGLMATLSGNTGHRGPAVRAGRVPGHPPQPSLPLAPPSSSL